jgi:hypothetical protein
MSALALDFDVVSIGWYLLVEDTSAEVKTFFIS